MHPSPELPHVSAADLALRLRFYRIDAPQLERLAALRPFAERVMGQVVDRFYEHLLGEPETRDFLDDAVMVERLKGQQTRHFLELFDGVVDKDYVHRRLVVGAVHARLAVPPRWYIGAYAWYFQVVHELLRLENPTPEALALDLDALQRIVNFDASLAIDAYIFGHMQAQRRHQEALREMSTPAIRVHDQVLLLPLVGTIDSGRAEQIMETVLIRIAEEQARVLLLDIAGIAVVDTQVADYLLKATNAVRLLGAQTILTGISPEVARTIVQLGVDLSTLHTRNTLAGGLDLALSMLNKAIVSTETAG